jgi:hypothetical protein
MEGHGFQLCLRRSKDMGFSREENSSLAKELESAWENNYCLGGRHRNRST